eukprot:7851554-Ditylum_brightwellii.AAC.1
MELILEHILVVFVKDAAILPRASITDYHPTKPSSKKTNPVHYKWVDTIKYLGEGREIVVCNDDAVKTCAEDG